MGDRDAGRSRRAGRRSLEHDLRRSVETHEVPRRRDADELVAADVLEALDRVVDRFGRDRPDGGEELVGPSRPGRFQAISFFSRATVPTDSRDGKGRDRDREQSGSKSVRDGNGRRRRHLDNHARKTLAAGGGVGPRAEKQKGARCSPRRRRVDPSTPSGLGSTLLPGATSSGRARDGPGCGAGGPVRVDALDARPGFGQSRGRAPRTAQREGIAWRRCSRTCTRSRS